MSEADWDRLQYYARKVKFFEFISEDHPRVHPSTYFRIGHLWSFALFPSLRRLHYRLNEMSISHIFLHLSPLLDSLTFDNIGGFENTVVGPFLATLSISPQMVRRIVLNTTGQMSVDVFKKSFINFKQLRSLELSGAVFMTDHGLWEVFGTLPSLENLTLAANNPASHPSPSPTHLPENPNDSQSGDPRYFEALESLHVTGSFFLIRRLLDFISSPCLKSIEVHPVINQVRDELEPEEYLNPSMTIVASKWSQSLKNFVIYSSSTDTKRHEFSKLVVFFKDLHNMETFRVDWRMKNWDDLKRLLTSWPKLRILNLNQTLVILSTLRSIAENCPQLRHLHIRLSTSTIPPFPSKSLCHNLEVLTVGEGHRSSQTTMEYQIKVTRYLDLIFPYLKSIEVPEDVFWLGIRDLVHLCRDAGLNRVESSRMQQIS